MSSGSNQRISAASRSRSVHDRNHSGVAAVVSRSSCIRSNRPSRSSALSTARAKSRGGERWQVSAMATVDFAKFMAGGELRQRQAGRLAGAT
jgi:hypothetical protein